MKKIKSSVVGITSAQRNLTLCYCTHRKRFREISEYEPSKFLAELLENKLELVNKNTYRQRHEKSAAKQVWLIKKQCNVNVFTKQV